MYLTESIMIHSLRFILYKESLIRVKCRYGSHKIKNMGTKNEHMYLFNNWKNKDYKGK
jgi:hypothetical protein